MSSDSGNPSSVSRLRGVMWVPMPEVVMVIVVLVAVLGNKGIYCIFALTISSTMPTSKATLVCVVGGIVSAAEVWGLGFRV